MNIRWMGRAATALLAVALAAQPGTSGETAQAAATKEKQEQARVEALRKLEVEQAQIERKLAELAERRAQLSERLSQRHIEQQAELAARIASEHSQEYAARAKDMARQLAERLEEFPQAVWIAGDGAWLGVSIEEVSADRVKELKLPAERGAYVKEVTPDSPAAKAGLKAGDVVTEFNGQRIESAAQLTRMVRETPSGRTVQLTVWRDGRAQQISATLASLDERITERLRDRIRVFTEPRDFNFRFDMPRLEMFPGPTPLLGISADDLSGQLGSYFGAPDGEGILVREVNSGSPAEKAGMKAGDVIVKVDGERVRSTSELRSELRERREKDAVSVTVLRNRSEVTLNVQMEKPKPPESRRSRTISRRIST